MADESKSWTIGELAEAVGGECVGDSAHRIVRPVGAGTADPNGITFAGNADYLAQALSVPIGAVLVGRNVESDGANLIRVDNPRAAFGIVLTLWERRPTVPVGVHPSAFVHETAIIDPSACIAAFASVGAGSSVGPGCVLHPHAVVGDGCRLGREVTLFPRAVLVQDVEIGDRTLIHAGAVIGADGFGFEWDGAKRVKIPQIGRVRIGQDCEIGANACIDRATLGETVIEDGVKIDNLCQIGHNVRVGEHTVITGMVGVGGSTVIGKRNVIGASSGISDHITIADDVTLGGRTGVASNIDQPGTYFGTPAQPMREALRTFMVIPKLGEMWQRLRALERKVEAFDQEPE